MPIVATYSTNVNDLTNAWSEDSEVLTKLKDNAANAIKAKDVRDAYYSTKKYILDQIASLSYSIADSKIYTNSEKVPYNIGGIAAGTTFNKVPYSTILNYLFYPHIPDVLFEFSNDNKYVINKEYGDEPTVNFKWLLNSNGGVIRDNAFNVIANINKPSSTSVLCTYSINGITYSINGATYFAYTQQLDSTYSGNFTYTPSSTDDYINNDTVYIMNSFDYSNNLPIYKYIIVKWYPAAYHGHYLTISNLPTSWNATYNRPDWACDVGLNEVVGGRIYPYENNDISYNGINAYAEHLVFSYPHSTDNRVFFINGLVNNDFTYSTVTYSNNNGYESKYDVWCSNQIYHSSFDIFSTKLIK